MEKLFLTIFNMSLTASIVLLVAMLIRVFLKKVPRWISCVLWGMVAFRLVCPFSLESVFSLMPSEKPVPPEIMVMDEPKLTTGIQVVNQAINPVLTEHFAPNPVETVNPMQVVIFIASNVWVLGVLILLSYAVISYLLLYKKVRGSVPFEGKVRLCDYIETPFILGIFKPYIYVPSGLSEEQFVHVIAHEKAHLKRLDHLWKPFGFWILTVHWFNPLVWIAYVMLCKDIEIACDEKVIRDMNRIHAASYAQTLLECSQERRYILMCPLAFGEVSVKERIKHVLNFKKPAFWIVIVSIFVCIVVGICFLTNAKSNIRNGDLPKITDKQLEKLYQTEFDKYTDKNPGLVKFDFMSLVYDGRIYTAGKYDRRDYVYPEGVKGNAWEKSIDDYPLEKIGNVYGELYIKQVYGELNADGQYADAYAWYDDINKVKGEIKQGIIWKLEGYDPKNQVVLTIPSVNEHGDMEYELIYFYHMNDVSIKKGGDFMNIMMNPRNVDSYGVIAKPDQLQVFSGEKVEEKYFIGDFINAPVVSPKSVKNMETYENIMIHEKVPYDRYIYFRDYGDGIIGYITPEGTSLFFKVEFTIAKNSKSDNEMILNTFSDDKVKESGGLEEIDNRETSKIDTETNDLGVAVKQAIIKHGTEYAPAAAPNEYKAASFIELGRFTTDGTIEEMWLYGVAMYMEANVSEEGIEVGSSSHIPVVLGFEVIDGKYVLTEYWEPGDGAYYVASIKEKFPDDIAEQAMDTQTTVRQQTMDCYDQIVRQSGMNPDVVIGKLVEQICSGDTSSSTSDYINAWPIEFRELIYYGRYTLNYRQQYYDGKQDLKAAVLEEACNQIQGLIGSQIVFEGTIVDNTIESLVPIILVEKYPSDNPIIPYDKVMFELPKEMAFWEEKVGTRVRIVCHDSFLETLPAQGDLISIEEVIPNRLHPITGEEIREVDSVPGAEQIVTDDITELLGFEIFLPENERWIQNVESKIVGENAVQINYYDGFAETECTLFVIRQEEPYEFKVSLDDNSRTTWEGKTRDGEHIYINVLKTIDGKQFYIMWQHAGYSFTIYGDVPKKGEAGDLDSICKTAVYIVQNINHLDKCIELDVNSEH